MKKFIIGGFLMAMMGVVFSAAAASQPECKQCLMTSCLPQVKTCANTTGCLELLQCSMSCYVNGQSKACVKTCLENLKSSPEAMMGVANLVSCRFDHCKTQCGD